MKAKSRDAVIWITIIVLFVLSLYAMGFALDSPATWRSLN